MKFLKKQREKFKNYKQMSSLNFNLLLLITLFSGVLLIISSYAWFYATLDVKIDFFKMEVSNHTGLFISLDGIDFSNSVVISKDEILKDLTPRYPTHTNQWASAGLFAVSSNGIPSPDVANFFMFAASGVGKLNYDKLDREYNSCINTCDLKCRNSDEEAEILCFNDCFRKCEEERNFFSTDVKINTNLINESRPSSSNLYIAFDFFLKNVSGSPKSDNLYLDTGTSILYSDENKDDKDGIINSLRIGLVKMGNVSLKSSVSEIQKIGCNSSCEMVIFEPNSTVHSPASIKRATKYNINLKNGEAFPTYAVIKEGKELELANGHSESGIPLNSEYFSFQNTITEEDFQNPIFEIPNAITKMRAYVWVEGQDIDSLETSSTGGDVNVIINLIKDLAGYY